MIKGPSMQALGRLAMREEGDHWNAYYAQIDTMEDALWLGSISMRFVQDKKRKKAFMQLMRECISDVIEEVVGERPAWPEPEGHPAPEQERTKS